MAKFRSNKTKRRWSALALTMTATLNLGLLFGFRASAAEPCTLAEANKFQLPGIGAVLRPWLLDDNQPLLDAGTEGLFYGDEGRALSRNSGDLDLVQIVRIKANSYLALLRAVHGFAVYSLQISGGKTATWKFVGRTELKETVAGKLVRSPLVAAVQVDGMVYLQAHFFLSRIEVVQLAAGNFSQKNSIPPEMAAHPYWRSKGLLYFNDGISFAHGEAWEFSVRTYWNLGNQQWGKRDLTDASSWDHKILQDTHLAENRSRTYVYASVYRYYNSVWQVLSDSFHPVEFGDYRSQRLAKDLSVAKVNEAKATGAVQILGRGVYLLDKGNVTCRVNQDLRAAARLSSDGKFLEMVTANRGIWQRIRMNLPN